MPRYDDYEDADHYDDHEYDDHDHADNDNVYLFLSSDDGDYKCEITYLDINRSCPVVQVIIRR